LETLTFGMLLVAIGRQMRRKKAGYVALCVTIQAITSEQTLLSVCQASYGEPT
jgi:hypothetical protein